MPRSAEGYLWTPTEITEGLESDSVISGSGNIASRYDVIVIGAGFAGLVAARDLSQNSKLKVLVVEGRDRIGGRTWTAKARGEEFEMGGTWVHWNQPHFYHELHRYSLHRNLKTSAGLFEPDANFFKPSGERIRQIDTAKADAIVEEIATAFFAIDGHTSRSLMPYPHEPLKSPRPWVKYDHLTIRQRLDQLTQFSEHDREMFESLTSSLGSAPATDIGLVEFLRWYSLGGHNVQQMFELCGIYKLGKGGMTSLARGIHADYRGHTLMESVVKEIVQLDSGGQRRVRVVLSDGSNIETKAVVCTVPLNCLSDVKFSPPLSDLRQQAIRNGHINQGAKIHFELAGVDKPWFAAATGRSADTPYCFAFVDHNGTNPSKSTKATYCIGFGYNGHLTDKTDSKTIIKGFQDTLRPQAEVQAYLTHDWMNDPLAKGVWSCWGPNVMSRYLEELQKPHGMVYFASGDSADGWRGFVDGAMEQGAKIAGEINTVLQGTSELGALRANM